MNNYPPKWADKLLRYICAEQYIDELQGDLHELYDRDLLKTSANKAKWRFILGTLTAFRFYRAGNGDNSHFTPNRMDIFKLNIKLGYRHFLANKLYTIVNILGLTIGFASFIFIYFWTQNERNTDKFHANAENIYLLTVKTDSTSEKARARWGRIGKKIKPKYPEIEHYAEVSDISVYLENGKTKLKGDGIATNPGFLSMFDFKLIEKSQDSLLSEPNTIILTKSLSEKFFGDQNALGKSLQLEHEQSEHYTVVGIVEDVPPNSSFQFEFIVPQKESGWGRMSMDFIQLSEQVDIKHFENKIKMEVNGVYGNYEDKMITELFPLANIYLYSDFGWFDHGQPAQISILELIAALILLVSILNFVNLATSKADNRAKEIGVKKVAGVARVNLMAQFYIESLFIISSAFLIALLLVTLAKNNLFLLSGTRFTVHYWDIDFITKSIVGIITIMIFAGTYPAVLLSSFHPIKALKGGMMSIKNSMFRKTLVVIQYSICIGLVIGTLVLSEQLNFIQSKDLGFEKEGIISFEFFNEELLIMNDTKREGMMKQFTYVNNELQKSSLIAASGFSEFPISNSEMDFSGFDIEPEKTRNINLASANKDFLNLYNVRLKEGLFYGDPRPIDSTSITVQLNGIIVNETGAEQLFSGDAVGKTITSFAWGKLEIIGVVEDFHYQHLSTPIKPLLIYGYNCEPKIVVRFAKGKIIEGIDYVRDLHQEAGAEIPFNYQFLDQELGKLYEKDISMTRLMTALSFLAFFIACLGLFAFSAYNVQRRVKEIGIRKVNGAMTLNIFKMLSFDFLKWVFLALVVAVPLSWYAMDSWLQNYAYRVDISLWIFVVAGLVTLVLSWLTISYHAVQASVGNPVDSLKNE